MINRTMIYLVLAVAVAVAPAAAAPFLVADPQLAADVAYYELEINGKIIRSDEQRDGNLVRIYHDCAKLPDATYRVRARAVGEYGRASVWTPFINFGLKAPPGVGSITLEPAPSTLPSPG